MSDPIDVRNLLETIAAYPILPPPGALPPDSEALRSTLAEITLGLRSAHVARIREAAAARGLPVDEVVRRARFVLACVTLPVAGTHYELLGVSPRASTREIRKRWAALIQQSHPDHAGPESGLDDQARRLIEAYQTLRDPGRRREYDAELMRSQAARPVVVPVPAAGRWPRRIPPVRWTWAPVVIGVAGIVVIVARWSAPTPLKPSPGLPRPTPPAVADAPSLDPLAHLMDRPSRGVRSAQDPAESVAASAPPSTTPPPLPSLLSRLTRSEQPDSPPVPRGPQGGAGGEAAREGEPEPARVVAVVPMASASTDPERPAPHPTRAVTEEAKPLAPAGERSSSEKSPIAIERMPPRKPEAAPARAPLAAVAPRRTEPARASREESVALIEAFRGAYERKDLDELMALFAADIRERDAVGRGVVHQLYVKNFRSLDSIRYEVTQVSAQPPSNDGDIIVHGRFRIRATYRGRGRGPLDVSGPIRWMLRREGDALRIVAIDYDVRTR